MLRSSRGGHSIFSSSRAPTLMSCWETACRETTKTPRLLTLTVRPAPEMKAFRKERGNERSGLADSETLTGVPLESAGWKLPPYAVLVRPESRQMKSSQLMRKPLRPWL